MIQMNNIQAIVTDIEGTTSSLSFVKDVLFPYAREHMAGFITSHVDHPNVNSLLDDVRRESAKDLDLDGVIAQLNQWIDEDKKITPLKSLQGLLWEKGFQQGDFSGHVYPDARQQLEHWRQQGIDLYVYSSGSIYAQKLLFGYSDYGDMNNLFSGHFDTTTGAKVDAASYEKIAAAIGKPVDSILFLSDIEAELDAARSAGMKTLWLVRDAKPDAQASHPQVTDFLQIDILS
jgi:enolase-phosphatase E1